MLLPLDSDLGWPADAPFLGPLPCTLTGFSAKLAGPRPQLQPQQPCCLASQPLSLSGPEAAGDHGRIYRALPLGGGHRLDVNATLLVSSLAKKSRDIYRGGSSRD